MTGILLVECRVEDYYRLFWEFLIATTVFNYLGAYLLLVVVVLQLPSLLFRFGHASGRIPRPLRLGAIAALVIMGLLTLATVGVQCYNSYVTGIDNYGWSYVSKPVLVLEAQGLNLAWATMFLVMVLAGMGASVVAANRGKMAGGRVGVSSQSLSPPVFMIV